MSIGPARLRSAIPAEDAVVLAERRALAGDDLLLALLPAAARFAAAPISGFRVGAVARGGSGAIYLGANLEFASASLAETVHAEQSAVNNAWLHGETEICAIAVTAAPCGFCRQFLRELDGAERLRVLIAARGAETLEALLPHAFGPPNLGVDGGLLRPQRHGLVLEAAATGDDAGDALAAAALSAADASYAPYTHSYSSVALRLANGGIVAGRYAENAAFNPSLPPLQSALAMLALRDEQRCPIRAALLVEAGQPRHEAAAAALLAAAAGVDLTVRAAAVG